ncbi:hypothetical protein M0R19_07880 [Candidatus Pacearchaeota archaeon]|nr:hypothetical protein [Candidatus Pacearchaeota archaeon]
MENLDSGRGYSLRDLLVATHLYYDIGNKSLRARAFGEIITKILFLNKNKKDRFNKIGESVSKFVGIEKITTEDIRSGLDFLQDKGVITKQGKFWVLKNEETEQIEVNLVSAQKRIDYILDKHFGKKIEKEKIKAWFKETSVRVFSQFSEVWAKRLRRELVKLPDSEKIKNIITQTLKEYKLEDKSAELITGFNAFLQDYDDIIVEQQVWSFAQAMLSAKLLTASIGPDPLSIGLFKGSKLLLDTNILFVAALEKGRLAKSFLSLAASIRGIDASFATTKGTEDEYEKVVARKREEALRVIENYPLDVLEKTRDAFLNAAFDRGCTDKDSLITFFDSIKCIPDKIGTENIEMLDDLEIEKARQNGYNDKRKQAEINAEWKSQRHFDKSKHSLEHDSALDSINELLRLRGLNSWIITVDGPMQATALKWAGQEPPTWIGVETFIQILAISSGGSLHNPENFAPLFSTIIKEDVHLNDSIYTLEDLDALLDLEERVKELENVEIEKFAAKMRKLRMSGKSKNDSELQLEIRRTFQRKKMSIDENTRKLERRVEETEESLKNKESYSRTTEDILIDQIYGIEKIKFFIKWSLGVIFILAIGPVLVYLGYSSWSANEGLALFYYGLSITEILIPFIFWISPNYRKIWTKAYESAKQKQKKLISKKYCK